MQQILVWCDDVAARWSATRPALPGSGAGPAPGPGPAAPPLSAPPAEGDGDEPPRLTPEEMASHNRLWTALPAGTEDQWLDSVRTYWQALQIFHHDGANDSRALVLDSILRHPARTLVRKR